MKRDYSALFTGALFILVAMQMNATKAQDGNRLFRLCYVDSYTYVWDVFLDKTTGALTGTVEVTIPACGQWPITGQVTGHNVSVTATNPNGGNDPGCSDGAGCSDFFTYTGQFINLAAGAFELDGIWTNPCNGFGKFTGSGFHGVCTAPLGQVVVSFSNTPGAVDPSVFDAISGAANASVAGYELSSYPNPFTTSVTISYTLPERSDVRLAVYDVLGREVAMLLNEAQEAGLHSVQWEAEASLPAGTYLYRLTAGTHTEVRQLMLLK